MSPINLTKTNNHFLFLASIVVMALFVFVPRVNASVIEQHIKDHMSNSRGYQFLETGLDGIFNSVTVYPSKNQTGVHFCIYGDAARGGSSNFICWLRNFVEDVPQTFNMHGGGHYAGTAFDFTPAHYYMFGTADAGAFPGLWYGCGTNCYGNDVVGGQVYSYNSGSEVIDTTTRDLAFDVNFTAPDGITILAPEDGEMFGTGAGIQLVIRFYNDNNNYNRFRYTFHNKEKNTDSVLNATISSTTPNLWSSIVENLPDANYRITAQMYNTANTASSSDVSSPVDIAIGDNIVFTHDLVPGIPGLTEAEICAGIATSTVFGALECSLKKVMVWTFYPSRDSINDFASSTEEITNAFPLNVYFDLAHTAQAAIASSSTSTNQTIGVPMIRKTSTSTQYYILPVLSSSSIPNAVGGSNANLIRNTLSYVIWLLVAGAIIISI